VWKRRCAHSRSCLEPQARSGPLAVILDAVLEGMSTDDELVQEAKVNNTRVQRAVRGGLVAAVEPRHIKDELNECGTAEALTNTKYGQQYGHGKNYLPPVSDEALLAWLTGHTQSARPSIPSEYLG
jgi:hypothetical protein